SVGVGVQDLMREWRRLGRVDSDFLDGARLHRFQNALETLHVHGFVQAVVEGFVYQRVVGNLDWPSQILSAGHLIGENGGKKIFGAHALDRRWNLSATAESEDGERAGCIPA